VETTEPAEAVSGGEVVYALEAESSGGYCIPEAQLAISGMIVARSIYDPLTVPAADGTYAPYLLESIDVNDDATSFTLTLRDGIRFHDGTDLDSTVLKNNLDAWLGRYPGRPSLLLPLILANVDTVEILDDLTVELTTKISWPALPALLDGSGRLGIMGQAQLDDPEHCDSELIGTGPYMLEDWVINDRLTATRNPDYWATDDEGNQLPYLDRIEFVPVPDSQTRVNGLLSGEYDMIITAEPTAIAALESEADNQTVDLVQTMVNAEVNTLMFNESKPPFDDPGAREAAMLALDRDTYEEVVRLGVLEKATGPFAPGVPGYLEDAGFPEHDPGRAKQLVADYEQRTGTPLEISYLHSANPASTQEAQFVQEQLEEAGMKVNLVGREQATLINEALGSDWNMMGLRNFPGPTPDGNYAWWHSASPVNFPKMNDPEIDSLLDAGRSELDQDAATEIYEDVNRALNERFHYLWLDWVRWTVATQPDLGGVVGPTLPSGQEPSPGMSTGHATAGLHYTQ
jgi:peptide/nickel transport system substrate-binding protein